MKITIEFRRTSDRPNIDVDVAQMPRIGEYVVVDGADLYVDMVFHSANTKKGEPIALVRVKD